MSANIYYGLTLSLIIPLGLLFIFSTRKVLKTPLWVPSIMVIGFYSLLFLTIPTLIDVSKGHNLLVMLPVLGIFYLILKGFTTIEWIRSFLVFLWSAGIMSFASGFTKAYCFYKNIDELSYTPHIVRIVIAFIILVVFCLIISRWNGNLLRDPNIPSPLWVSALAIPIIIFYQNVILIGYRESMVSDPLGYTSYVMMLLGNLVLFLILTNVFNTVATLYLESARILEEKRILEFQKNQYGTITKDVERTGKLLHDFKHTLNTLRTLAKKENNEEILSYLDTMTGLSLSTEVLNYCHHAPINSVLNHYAFRARENEIPLNLQVNIPDRLPMEDYEICSLIGNLMENAIDACKILPKDERSFSLSLVMEENTLIIVSSNSFDGVVKKTSDGYLSTKHSGHGIGIRSITDTVTHYGGDIKVHYNEKEFFVDIMIEFV